MRYSQSLSFKAAVVLGLVAALALSALVVPAEAARTTLTPLSPLGPYPTLPVSANALDITWTAADPTNFNQFTFNGSFLILARNSHATNAYTVTLTSVADSKKRTGDITTYSLEAGDTMMFLVNNIEGWKQSDNFFYLTGSNASVLFAIIRLP